MKYEFKNRYVIKDKSSELFFNEWTEEFQELIDATFYTKKKFATLVSKTFLSEYDTEIMSVKETVYVI